LHAQEFVPGPVDVHVAFAPQPPLAIPQLLMATQTVPLPA
jgi:hypothetical protein